jgi:hypothetical protein
MSNNDKNIKEKVSLIVKKETDCDCGGEYYEEYQNNCVCCGKTIIERPNKKFYETVIYNEMCMKCSKKFKVDKAYCCHCFLGIR